MNDSLDHTLMALAHPTRRAILQQLSSGDARVTDLARPFSVSLNSVSKHIRILERARLVERRRAGREHLLNVRREPLDEAAAWIHSMRAMWTSSLDALDALLADEDRAATAATRAATEPAKVRKSPTQRGRTR